MCLPPRWVIAVSSAVAAAILGDSLLYAVLPIVWPGLGLQAEMVGVLLSANRFVRLASNPFAGWVVGRTGARGPFLAAVFVAAATTAAYALGLGFWVLLAARALWGACWSFLRLGGYLAALDASSSSNRGYYLGFFNGVTRFGSFVAVLAGGFLTDLVGFETTVYLFTALTLVGGLAVLRERPPHPARSATGVAAGPESAIEGSDPALAGGPTKDADRATRYRIGTVYLAVFLHGLAVSGLVTATLGLWLRTLYGPTVTVFFVSAGVATLTGTLLSARFLADFLWGPVSGHLSDRHGRLRLTLLAGGIEALALLGLAQADELGWTILAAVGLFLAATALQSALDATAGELAPPDSRARVMSWYATCLDLGAATGPLIGYLIGAGLGLDAMYRSTALLLILTGLVYAAVFRQTTPTAGARR